MQFSHPDSELVEQPIGYWSWAAHTSVVAHIRQALATVGLTQPQWWVLNQLDDAAGAHSLEGLIRTLRGYLDVGDQLNVDIDDLVARGVIVVDDMDQVAMTPEGQRILAAAKEVQITAHTRIHGGVTDDDLLTTMKVLQRMIHNTDGKFWHH
ncbi:MarR family winged helix-turn-helix transcriptional regulator [Nocardia sp. NPDC051570]|uniref:MarR family winged helix-turn-helix transcriptional regulator n=1 Tax=Nocardia sp. NPDC051570 TaxID=3364324 RepID=UPI0037B35086